MSEQSVNGPEYLARRGWKPGPFQRRWTSPEESIRNATAEQAREFQHARDAAALDRVLALCADTTKIAALVDTFPAYTFSSRYGTAFALAAEITRLVGAHGASASAGEEKNDA